ncbi:MAG TPA: YceI family protein [Novosphingobium sp.]|nr:YceI family protein [Novosphingobium sp.]HZV09914.1 YceI family protein [Novosphingobium sp.]
MTFSTSALRGLVAAAAILAASPAFAQTPGNAAPTAAKAGTYGVEPWHTRVQFSVDHMGFTDWFGDFTGISGQLVLDPAHAAADKVDITIPVASVSTTNTKLDGELKSADWFDAARYPEIHFVSTKVVRTGPAAALITGDLTFHGVTKPVTLAAHFHGAGVNPLSKGFTVGFDATTSIKRSDFGVKTYLPMIGDKVTLRISAAFEKKD